MSHASAGRNPMASVALSSGQPCAAAGSSVAVLGPVGGMLWPKNKPCRGFGGSRALLGGGRGVREFRDPTPWRALSSAPEGPPPRPRVGAAVAVGEVKGGHLPRWVPLAWAGVVAAASFLGVQSFPVRYRTGCPCRVRWSGSGGWCCRSPQPSRPRAFGQQLSALRVRYAGNLPPLRGRNLDCCSDTTKMRRVRSEGGALRFPEGMRRRGDGQRWRVVVRPAVADVRSLVGDLHQHWYWCWVGADHGQGWDR